MFLFFVLTIQFIFLSLSTSFRFPETYPLIPRSFPIVHEVAIAHCNSVIITEHTGFFMEPYVLLCTYLQILRCYFCSQSKTRKQASRGSRNYHKVYYTFHQMQDMFLLILPSLIQAQIDTHWKRRKNPLYIVIFFNENTIVYPRRSSWGTRNLPDISYPC